jgi:HD-GYP domain-containing protein (c-di-GMP phosphodiesterase class II)
MDFTPLRISTVKPQRELNFDLYIYFKDQYLCYSKRGETLTEEKYQKLKQQKIAKFFITEDDEINYQNFLDKLLSDSLSNPDVNIEAKMNIVEGAATSAIERMQQDPASESAFKMTNSAAKSLRQMIKNNPETLKKIFGKKADKNEEIIKHSLNVCVLSVRLGEILKCSEQDLDDLACAALIHDVSLANMSEESRSLFFKQKKEYNIDDKKNYYLHCKNAVTMLQEKPYVNKTILDLIANHEEALSGSGPNKKRKLTKLEEILSLVNNYDKRTLTEKTTPAETLKDMMIDELGNYDLDLLNEFKKVLHAEGLLELENNSN